ncbi:MAG: hypothetical protein ABI655_02840 [Phenylobacterium sp.]
MARALALVAVLLAAGSATAAPRLTEAQARAFVARQDAAWNGRDAAAYFATFLPSAVFVAQARSNQGGVVPYGRSTLPEARAQAQRVFARGPFHQASTVDRVEISPDGLAARLLGHQVSTTAGRTACAEIEQRLVLARGRMLSTGQTETAVRCRR